MGFFDSLCKKSHFYLLILTEIAKSAYRRSHFSFNVISRANFYAKNLSMIKKILNIPRNIKFERAFLYLISRIQGCSCRIGDY